jgi:lipopolysaccharide/colanic/teichoic acid biosynthesis glycosyltransferase
VTVVPPRAPTAAATATVAEVPAARFSYVCAKRALDILLATAAVVVLAPVLLLVAALILVDSGRPVLFVQQRVGAYPRRHGRVVRWETSTFSMLKFRTMLRGAAASPLHEDFVRAFVAGKVDGGATNGPPAFKLADDPRVTRLGRWLRTTSLDELPQLFNVLAGTMSLVGPRPVPPYEVAAYEQCHMSRLAARPGITGPWQVHGRGRVSFEQMVRLDIEYVSRQSLRHDLGLLLRTLPCVLARRGAR